MISVWPSSIRCRVAIRAPATWSTDMLCTPPRSVDCSVTNGTSIDDLRQNLEHPHLGGDHDQRLDRLAQQVVEARP